MLTGEAGRSWCQRGDGVKVDSEGLVDDGKALDFILDDQGPLEYYKQSGEA